jgi:RNA polymerase sigma-70 factor, ECF subfamily
MGRSLGAGVGDVGSDAGPGPGAQPPQAADWLVALLHRFDARWLVAWSGLDEDRRDRAGVRRISGDDVAGRLTQLLELYERDRDKLVRVARGRLGAFAQDAEDVVQEVMRKLCERPPALRDPGKLASYVYTAIYNETSTWGSRAAVQRARQAPGDQEVVTAADPAPGVEDVVVFHMVMTRALASLSPRERELIELVDIGRLTLREAADKLGITIGTAKSYHHGARLRLREDPGLTQVRTVA